MKGQVTDGDKYLHIILPDKRLVARKYKELSIPNNKTNSLETGQKS